MEKAMTTCNSLVNIQNVSSEVSFTLGDDYNLGELRIKITHYQENIKRTNIEVGPLLINSGKSYEDKQQLVNI